MKGTKLLAGAAALLFVLGLAATGAWAAYHHEGEQDAGRFLSVHPEKRGTKLDHCALCHTGGVIEGKKGPTTYGSCQYCHKIFGYDGQAGSPIEDTLNPYGVDYKDNGRLPAAVTVIETEDSDGDGYTNGAEIAANTYPGNAGDHPGLVVAPARVYTRAQLAAMPRHKQFLLMNTTRSGDFYAEYTGVVLEDLLADAGALDPTATTITVYAPDGYAMTYPVDQAEGETGTYPVEGVYEAAEYHYDAEADQSLNPESGWCDYSAPSCKGRNDGDPITVAGGLRMILAYLRDGRWLDTGILNEDNKLDGEGPFRLVPPQFVESPPDQLSTSDVQDVVWPFDDDADHNAGQSARTATIIKVGPLPEGMTDIDIYEAGWDFVDHRKIVVYGAIDNTDTNGNGILDSEERVNGEGDANGDGTPDFQDPRTARLRHANGLGEVVLNVDHGALENVQALLGNDSMVNQAGRPQGLSTPYGVLDYRITGLDPNSPTGEEVTVTLDFPGNIPTNARIFKITNDEGWREIPFGSNDGDGRITLTLKDGDPDTDADKTINGVIVDPVTATVESTQAADSEDSSSCFIQAILR